MRPLEAAPEPRTAILRQDDAFVLHGGRGGKVGCEGSQTRPLRCATRCGLAAGLKEARFEMHKAFTRRHGRIPRDTLAVIPGSVPEIHVVVSRRRG